MNANEPVAWMMENLENTSAYLTFEKPTREMKISHQAIPLYTYEQITPSGFLNASKPIYPTKTLTDEEIEEVAQALIDDCSYCSLHFARAILRKAQEK